MIEFLHKENEEYYNHLVEMHDEWKNKGLPFKKIYHYLEVCDCGDFKMVHWPTALYWWKFKGTFQELHDKFQKELPNMCPDVKFYSVFTSPILI